MPQPAPIVGEFYYYIRSIPDDRVNWDIGAFQHGKFTGYSEIEPDKEGFILDDDGKKYPANLSLFYLEKPPDPKFKVGDWLVSTNTFAIGQVLEIVFSNTEILFQEKSNF